MGGAEEKLANLGGSDGAAGAVVGVLIGVVLFGGITWWMLAPMAKLWWRQRKAANAATRTAAGAVIEAGEASISAVDLDRLTSLERKKPAPPNAPAPVSHAAEAKQEMELAAIQESSSASADQGGGLHDDQSMEPPRPLPRGWSSQIDPASGATFYKSESGGTRWTAPEDGGGGDLEYL